MLLLLLRVCVVASFTPIQRLAADTARARLPPLPLECRAPFALSGLERPQPAAVERSGATWRRGAGVLAGAGSSIFVSGWMPGAVFADNPPPLPGVDDPLLAVVGVLALVLAAAPIMISPR